MEAAMFVRPVARSRRRIRRGAPVAVMAMLTLVVLAVAAPAGLVGGAETRPTSVTFRYHAFGNGSPVSLTFDEQKSGQTFSQGTVSDGGTFTVTTGGSTGVDMLLGSYN